MTSHLRLVPSSESPKSLDPADYLDKMAAAYEYRQDIDDCMATPEDSQDAVDLNDKFFDFLNAHLNRNALIGTAEEYFNEGVKRIDMTVDWGQLKKNPRALGRLGELVRDLNQTENSHLPIVITIESTPEERFVEMYEVEMGQSEQYEIKINELFQGGVRWRRKLNESSPQTVAEAEQAAE